jgi:predicted Holliday junction resolvase-like endonuclease
MSPEDLLITIIAFLAGIIITYLILQSKVRTTEDRWRTEFERWKIEYTDEIRKDSVDRSRFTLKGKIAEQMAPFLPGFDHNPSDARFIGSPVDFVVFDGYTEAKDGEGNRGGITVVLVEVKKGKGTLRPEQRMIRQAVEERRIRWETLILGEDSTEQAS